MYNLITRFKSSQQTLTLINFIFFLKFLVREKMEIGFLKNVLWKKLVVVKFDESSNSKAINFMHLMIPSLLFISGLQRYFIPIIIKIQLILAYNQKVNHLKNIYQQTGTKHSLRLCANP